MDSTLWLIIAGLVSFGVTLLLVPLARRLGADHGWVDRAADDRKLHSVDIPHTGGIAIAAGIMAGLAVLLFGVRAAPGSVPLPAWPFWVGVALLLVVGIFDDLYGLGFKKKFLAQLVAAYLALVAGYRVDVSSIGAIWGDPFDQALLSIPLTLLWVVGVINAINLIDGMDGLSSGLVAIAFATMVLLVGPAGSLMVLVFATVVIGAVLGFLRYNFHPASIFMGDTGSLVLGFLLAVCGLRITSGENLVFTLAIPALAIGVPVIDTAVAYIRRLIEGRSPFMPDRDHIHHRLFARLGESQRTTVLLLYAGNILLGLGAWALLRSEGWAQWGLLAGIVLVVLVTLRRLDYLRIRASVSQVKAWRAARALEQDGAAAMDTPVHVEAAGTEGRAFVRPATVRYGRPLSVAGVREPSEAPHTDADRSAA